MNNRYNNSHRCGATKRQHSTGSSKKFRMPKLLPAIPNLGSVFIGFFIGIAVSSIVFFYFSPSDLTLKIPSNATRETTNKVATKQSKTASEAKQQATAPEAVDEQEVVAKQRPEPRFDFYTELTKNSHETALNPAKAPVLDLKSSPTPINKYLVQVAAFKNRSDADAMKAKLTLNGMDAKVQIAKLDDGMTWHRVVIGPFKNETLAAEQKDMLRTLNINAALVLKQNS